MSHNYLLCQVHGDEPAGKPGILLMRQTKTDRSIADTPTSFSYALRSNVTEDRSPPVGFWEAEGPFVTSNVAVMTHPLRLHLWVKYLHDLARLNNGETLNDFGNHCEVCFESVVRRPNDDDAD